jgi:predicted anti-sigma-YlaC factor YlaD
MKYLVIASFIAIIGSLATALVFMMRGGSHDDDTKEELSSPASRRMAKALAFRIGFSVVLFAVVLISYWMGWIQPTGLPVGA